MDKVIQLSISLPRKKHVKKWEKAFDKKWLKKEEKIVRLSQFSSDRNACFQWRDVVYELEEEEEKIWKEIEA